MIYYINICATIMPLLKPADVESLLSNFPTMRLSYEVPVHKNDNSASGSTSAPVRDSKCFIIPKGRRCVAWATEWNRKKIFAIIEIQFHSRNHVPALFRKFHEVNGWYPGPVQVFDTCFHSELTYGTVFGGVLFRPSHAVATTTVQCGHQPHAVATTTVQCFSIIHVYWYKGAQIPNLTLSSHVDMCERIFTTDQSLRQVAYTQSNSIIFGLPVLCSSSAAAVAPDDAFLQSLPYPVYSILYRSNTTTRVYSQNLFESGRSVAPATTAPVPAPVPRHQPQISAPVVPAPVASVPVPQAQEYIKPDDDMLTNIQAVFIVRPNVQNDIYELFVKTRSGAVFHNFAHIPNYKTSVMMNRLFRNIRENERLDAMEESETEEEFENIELDKYVSLHKEYKFVCKLNKKFCRWVPISVVPETSEVANDFQVKQHESRYNITMYRRTAATATAGTASSTAPVRRPFSRGGGGGR